MRYIRTKDGKIYDTNKCISENYPLNPNDEIFWEFESIAIYENEVSKKADTVEELCDRFVLIDLKEKHTYISNDIGSLPCIYCYDKKNTIVYGAIWTDKGLIYKAKMNEKGELELL